LENDILVQQKIKCWSKNPFSRASRSLLLTDDAFKFDYASVTRFGCDEIFNGSSKVYRTFLRKPASERIVEIR